MVATTMNYSAFHGQQTYLMSEVEDVVDAVSCQVPLLPGQSEGRAPRTRRYTFNLIVTGRCNTGCTYCHYYENRRRRDIWYDLPEDQFDLYLQTIAGWQAVVPGITHVRFSGGDPIVLGHKIFSLADRCHEATGISPFMLTAGKSLSRSWIDGARASRLSGVKVSIENPFSPDPGAPKPHEIVSKVRNFDSIECPVRLGVCVLRPSSYRDLYRISRWFFDEVGHLPVFHEVNYGFYERPTEADFTALEENVARVLADFGDDGTLSLFPSVSPELSFGAADPYVFDLDLENSYGISAKNVEEKVLEIANNLRTVNYPKANCLNRECPWWEFCDNIKWYWKSDGEISSAEKLQDYCRIKRILNDCFYKYLVDREYRGTHFSYTSADSA